MYKKASFFLGLGVCVLIGFIIFDYMIGIVMNHYNIKQYDKYDDTYICFVDCSGLINYGNLDSSSEELVEETKTYRELIEKNFNFEHAYIEPIYVNFTDHADLEFFRNVGIYLKLKTGRMCIAGANEVVVFSSAIDIGDTIEVDGVDYSVVGKLKYPITKLGRYTDVVSDASSMNKEQVIFAAEDAKNMLRYYPEGYIILDKKNLLNIVDRDQYEIIPFSEYMNNSAFGALLFYGCLLILIIVLFIFLYMRCIKEIKAFEEPFVKYLILSTALYVLPFVIWPKNDLWTVPLHYYILIALYLPLILMCKDRIKMHVTKNSVEEESICFDTLATRLHKTKGCSLIIARGKIENGFGFFDISDEELINAEDDSDIIYIFNLIDMLVSSEESVIDLELDKERIKNIKNLEYNIMRCARRLSVSLNKNANLNMPNK